MGDSKKRAAGRELSRDNPGLDDEEEVPGQETGTFKRASDEVLANRRIVKVKRSQPSSTPSSNPFAAIRLVPPTVSTPVPEPVNDLEKSGKPASENAESPQSVNKEDGGKKSEVVENDENAPVVEKEGEVGENDENTPVAEKEKDENKDGSDKKDENTPVVEKERDQNEGEVGENDENTPVSEEEKNEKEDGSDKKDENTPAADENKDELEKTDYTPAPGSVNSFGQLSSSQNAFTGLAGTGFSSSTFTFGSIPKTDTPTFPSFSFGTNGNSSLFGNPGKPEGGTKAQPSMQEVQVETGEENERAVFTADSILFEFLEGGWKERGKGELKVNVLTSGTKKARLVMRARGNYRLILNASIFPDMKLTNMEKKGITFACLNSTGEGQNSLSTFALKFKDPSVVDEFRSVVMEHKDKTGAAPPTLKTPENSPKASDE